MALAGSAMLLAAAFVVFASRVEPGVTAEAASAPVAAAVRPATPTQTLPSGRPEAMPVTALDYARAGAASYAQGNFEASVKEFEQALEKNPNDPRALNNLAQVLVRIGRAKEAITYFDRAIALKPSEWEPHFNLANAYSALGQWNRAIAEYRVADGLFPDDYVTLYNLGLALHKGGEEEAAVATFQRAIALAPEEPTFHLSLGISYERLNRITEAAQAYETFIKTAPSHPDAEKVRVRVAALRGQPQETIPVVQEAVTPAPGSQQSAE